MTQEEKQLLLKDLCARLPYGVYGQFDVPSEKRKFERVLVVGDMCGIFSGVCLFKPYLRPLSSMTDKDKKEYKETCFSGIIHTLATFEWFHEHHFDYRSLIEKGLALEAPEGMYKTE